MDVDLMGPDVDALDQRGKEGTLAWSGQRGPALPDLRGACDEPALRFGIGKPCRFIDAAGIEKPLTHSAGHELFDLRGRDAQPKGPLALIFGDQRAGDIVAVARALLDRVGRRHPVAVAVEQHPTDDCNIYVRSRRAGERVMASVSRFLTKKLRLTVNETKSA